MPHTWSQGQHWCRSMYNTAGIYLKDQTHTQTHKSPTPSEVDRLAQEHAQHCQHLPEGPDPHTGPQIPHPSEVCKLAQEHVQHFWHLPEGPDPHTGPQIPHTL